MCHIWGGSRTAPTSKMELFVIIVNGLSRIICYPWIQLCRWQTTTPYVVANNVEDALAKLKRIVEKLFTWFNNK